MKSLRMLVAALRDGQQLVSAPDRDIGLEDVTDDSRRVRPGCLFCAVTGSIQDGHRFVGDAVAQGAAAVVVTRPLELSVPQVLVRDSRAALGIIARAWHGCPGDGLRIIGVTGTNGKTTTVALLRHLCNADGSAGSIGTIGVFDGIGRMPGAHGNLTTPGALELQGVLAALRARGARTVVMEASSHALDQHRLDTIRAAAAVYTNLTHDHLDYHPTLEAYRDAKALLSTYLVEGGVEVVNDDDPAWRALPRRATVRRVGFGRQPNADVRAEGVVLGPAASTATFVFGDERAHVDLPLVGDFNVTNALGAAATAWAIGLSPAEIAARLRTSPQVPGRLERLVDADRLVLRDYAHTPDGLERAIGAVRLLTRGRLIVLFGAGGDRDRRKRPIMGDVVARLADLAIVTSDNPRTEDPERILDEIEAGMGTAPRLRISDRHEAIRRGLALLQPGDCLLLAGKGHETYQVIGTERIPFDEREIVRATLEGHSGP